VNENGPNGSVSWRKTTNPDGTSQWTQDTTLNPEQQQLYSANVGSQLQQAQLLSNAGKAVGDALSKPADYSQVPAMQTGLGGNYQLNTYGASSPYLQHQSGGQNLRTPQAGNITPGQMPSTPDASYGRYSVNGFDPSSVSAAQNPAIQLNTGSQLDAPAPNALNGNYNLSPQSQIAAPGVTAGNINIPGVTAQSQSIDPSGKIATPGQSITDRATPLLQALSGYQNKLGGIDPLQFNQQASDAAYNNATRYLTPQVQQQQQALEARLSEQGFVPGTPGYQQAMQNFQDTNNRAYASARDSATLQGAQIGQNASSTSMQAIQAQIAAALSGANVGLSNDQAASNENLNRANFGSGQNAQDFNQRLANAQFGANRNDAQFSQGVTGAQLGMTQNNDRFSQGLASANFNAQQGSNDFSQRLQGANFGTGRADTQFAQGLQGAQFAAGQQQDQFGRNLSAANYTSQNNQNDFANQLAAGNFNASQQQQGFNNQLADANLGMSQDSADYTRQLQDAQLGTQQQQQNFSQQSALADQLRQSGLDANQVSQQLYQNNAANIAANNTTAQQSFQDQMAQITAQNAAIAQQQGLDVNSAEFQNQARTQAIAEMLQQRSQPLNELNALRMGMQVQMPTGNGQAQTPNIANTDVMGAYNAQYQSEMNAYNAKVGSQNALTSGLASLGGAALANPNSIAQLASLFSDIRLKSDMAPWGKTARGHNLYSYEIFGRKEIGVIAQEVAQTDPSAVHTHESGYLMVDYSKV
jgi:hypothetical protein